MSDRPLTLDIIRGYDPAGGRGDRYLCPFVACGDHRKDAEHRTLHIDEAKLVYYCFSCGAGGRLGSGKARVSDRQRARVSFGR